MTGTRHTAATIALMATVLCCIAHGDDSSLRVTGGAVAPMDEHPDVSMDECIINAEVHPTESYVRCRFVFTNHGPAQSVLMGFPATSYLNEGTHVGYVPELAN